MATYNIVLHKHAQKNLSKAPARIKRKASVFVEHLCEHGTADSPFPLKPLQGSYKKYDYVEAKIDKDYRIIFRREDDTFYIRFAGTHNQLGTG